MRSAGSHAQNLRRSASQRQINRRRSDNILHRLTPLQIRSLISQLRIRVDTGAIDLIVLGVRLVAQEQSESVSATQLFEFNPRQLAERQPNWMVLFVGRYPAAHHFWTGKFRDSKSTGARVAYIQNEDGN